jgi:hypothetical protein
MCRRSEAAFRNGERGYEQEFRVVKPDRTYWLHERVSITPQGAGQWLLFGVMLDVSALKEAEAARRASEAQLGTLLNSANCLLWQAQVMENSAGRMDWNLYIPQSSLYRELFRGDPAERGSRMWSKLNLESSELSVPELPEMNARATAAIRDGLP